MNISDLVPWRSRSNVPVGREEEERPFGGLSRDLSLFEDFFRGFDLTPFREERLGVFNPRVDVTETDNEIRVTAELPGMDQNDIDVSMARDVLTIKGEKKAEREDKGESYYRMERSYGAFQRAIPLPAEVLDLDKVDATFKNGVLTINLPKRPDVQQKTKRITVKKN